MKLMNIAIIFSIVCLFIFVLYTRPRGLDGLLKNEAKKREEIIKEIELLKSEKKIIDLSIENIKKYIDAKESNLMFNIQEVKNKSNVQVRNVTDSSFVSLLRELQPTAN